MRLMARALGAHSQRVEESAKLADALCRALANAPALGDGATSQAAISSDARKGLGFVPGFPAPHRIGRCEEQAAHVTVYGSTGCLVLRFGRVFVPPRCAPPSWLAARSTVTAFARSSPGRCARRGIDGAPVAAPVRSNSCSTISREPAAGSLWEGPGGPGAGSPACAGAVVLLAVGSGSGHSARMPLGRASRAFLTWPSVMWRLSVRITAVAARSGLTGREPASS